MPRLVDIACLQTRPQPDFASALDEVMPMAEAAIASGADMLFLPEYCGGLKTDGGRLAPPSAPEAAHPVLRAMRTLADKGDVWIQIGSVAVDGPAGKIINRGYMLDNQGSVAGSYDKINLFDVDISATEVYRESDTVAAGGTLQTYETPFGTIGHTICYDLRFPGLFRALAQSGAEILTCPAAFTKTTGEAHWHVLNRARAIENTCFVVSPCAVGSVPGGGESYGHSLVISPWGEVIADGGTLPGVVHARIDLDLVAETRKRIPSLSHDRPFAPADGRVVA